jgi:hypothetical protein
VALFDICPTVLAIARGAPRRAQGMRIGGERRSGAVDTTRLRPLGKRLFPTVGACQGRPFRPPRSG